MTAHQTQEQRKETERQEPEDGYFGRNEDGSYCYESAPERGGEVPTQDFIEINNILHKTHNVTKEYSHRMFCIVDLLNNKKIELEQIDLDNGFISFMSCNLFYDLLFDDSLFGKLFNCLDINRIPHSYELVDILIKKRCSNSKDTPLKYTGYQYLTLDFPLYVVEKGEAILYLARRENNPMFSNVNNLRDTLYQLLRKHDYKPKKEEVERVINANSTLRIPLSKLNLKDDYHNIFMNDNNCSHFEVDLRTYCKQLNPTQKAFVERVYGEGENGFDRVMNHIKEKVIGDEENTREEEYRKHLKLLVEYGTIQCMYVLNPEYVLEHCEKVAISRPSFLKYCNHNSSFSAAKWNFDEYLSPSLITLENKVTYTKSD